MRAVQVRDPTAPDDGKTGSVPAHQGSALAMEMVPQSSDFYLGTEAAHPSHIRHKT